MSAPAAIARSAWATVLTAAIRTAGPGGGPVAGAGRRGVCPVTRRAWHDSYCAGDFVARGRGDPGLRGACRPRPGGGDGRVPQRLPAVAPRGTDRGRRRAAAPAAGAVGI